ncbi:carbohydrate kinase family protein [Patescibacteria group bacterium]|nr:carbohydrate kinase family protein [Patescibacteria group bacterium]
MNTSFDFVAVGDITTDAFIRIEDARVNCDINHEKCQLCVSFGDKVPYESVDVIRAVGNSPNASVSAARLGLSSALVTNLGDDQNGKECLESLKKDKVSINYTQIHKGEETNYHYVLWYEEERTILIKHHEYDYVFPDLPPPKWMYLSSLAKNSLPYHHEIALYLKKYPDVNLAFQPGTFQIKLGYDKLSDVYKLSKLFFCNVQEAKRILNTGESDIVKLLGNMKKLGPGIVIITDGPNGSYVYDGREAWHMPMYPDPKPPVDRTGAGDSFSSTFTSALALGKTIPEALAWGPINSMSVVQYVGAQKGLLSRDKLEEYLAKAPEDYKLTKIL